MSFMVKSWTDMGASSADRGASARKARAAARSACLIMTLRYHLLGGRRPQHFLEEGVRPFQQLPVGMHGLLQDDAGVGDFLRFGDSEEGEPARGAQLLHPLDPLDAGDVVAFGVGGEDV